MQRFFLQQNSGSSTEDGEGEKDSLFIPLSIMLRPEVQKELSSMAGMFMKSINASLPADSKNLFHESKEFFMRLMGGAIVPENSGGK
jgi:hypothetical protein